MIKNSIINDIKPVKRDNDKQTLSLIDWYIKEQEKQLKNLKCIISKLKSLGNN